MVAEEEGGESAPNASSQLLDEPFPVLAQRVRTGKVQAAELTEIALARIASTDEEIGAMVRVDADGAREAAASVDRRRAAGEELGRLAGVPVAIKDNLSWRGRALTCGSRILQGYRAPYDATVVERLRAQGAVLVGQTNMDEFAMGSSCENSALGVTRNPWDPQTVPGGSSGGSAAAVAAGLVPLSLGSDTGGSVRQPAAFCGVVGFKPSYGRISRYGLVAFASSLDQVGPLTRSVEEAAIAYEVIAGPDPRDSTCLASELEPLPTASSEAKPGELSGLRIGRLSEIDDAALAPDVARNWHQSLEHLSELGATIEEVSVANLPAAVAAYYVIANSEASANLSRFDGARYGRRVSEATSLRELYTQTRTQGFGPEVKRRILLGTFALSSGYYEAYYARAVGVAREMARQFEQVFENVDLIATPTSPTAAFRLGERTDDPLTMYLSDVFTTPASLCGLPALSVPSGLGEGALPLALQLIGPRLADASVLRAGRAFEQAVGWQRRRPGFEAQSNR